MLNTSSRTRMKAPATEAPARPDPQIFQVTENVYVAVNFARSNVIFITTATGVVVIDSTESMAAAREVLSAFREISELPISHLIYTHFHGDHIRGAKVFCAPETKIIAQKRLLEEVARVDLLLPYNKHLTSLQFGYSLKNNKPLIASAQGQAAPDNGQAFAVQLPAARSSRYVNHMRRAVFIHPLTENGYVAPTITFDEQYSFEEGGVRFELYHAPGETLDQLIVWLPQQKVLFSADLFYQSFPMLSSPMKPDRPVRAWIASLERMRDLRADYLVPSHNKPLAGADHIATVLDNYAKAIRHVHDETVKGINQGLPLERIRARVKLPRELAQLPYLQPFYGCVEWAVNGIYRQYTGWYTLNPTDLRPNPRAVWHKAVVETCGGTDPLVTRAGVALEQGQNQLVLELTDIVLSVEPKNRRALRLRIMALRRLGALAKNGVEQNLYFSAAQEYFIERQDLRAGGSRTALGTDGLQEQAGATAESRTPDQS